MRITVTEEDLNIEPRPGLAHPIANALHRSVGGYWMISKSGRLAYEMLPPCRAFRLPENVALFLKQWRSKEQIQPFTFEIHGAFGVPVPTQDR